MRKVLNIASIGLFLALFGCSATSSETLDINSGAVLSSSSRSTNNSMQVESSSSVEEIAPLLPKEAIAASYDSAVVVHSAIEQAWPTFDESLQDTLADIFLIFTEDIELLGYYKDVTEHETLTKDEEDLVANLLIDIDEAMSILLSALDTLL